MYTFVYIKILLYNSVAVSGSWAGSAEEDRRRLRIAIIGAGGVGGTFGAALHRSGQDVWFLARGPHLAAMRDRGLRIVGPRGDFHLTNVKATNQPEEIGPVAVALLTVKLWDLEETLKGLQPLIAPDTVVLTLQNGVDAPQRAAEAIGAGHVAAGSCFVNARIAEPGLIVQSSEAQAIVAGMLTGDSTAILERFAAACRAAGIDLDVTTAPLDALWEKFLQLVPISAMTALLRRPIGAVREDADSWGRFLQILHETVLVGRATGARITPEVVDRRVAYVSNLPYDATSSMATDLLRGRRLELPWLSGRVTELGRHHGIPTPANDVVLAALEPFALGDGSGAA
jgi:2-dehydropantoate 2-reductase